VVREKAVDDRTSSREWSGVLNSTTNAGTPLAVIRFRPEGVVMKRLRARAVFPSTAGGNLLAVFIARSTGGCQTPSTSWRVASGARLASGGAPVTSPPGVLCGFGQPPRW